MTKSSGDLSPEQNKISLYPTNNLYYLIFTSRIRKAIVEPITSICLIIANYIEGKMR